MPTGPAWHDLARPKARSRHEGETIYGLDVAIEDGTLTVRSEMPMITWPDLHLLARWWVNGRPVRPARPESVRSISLGRLVSTGTEMRVDFRLPKTLGPLKVGDTVGLQLLYSPGMIAQLPTFPCPETLASSSPTSTARVPLLSRRLDVRVTEPMLASRL